MALFRTLRSCRVLFNPLLSSSSISQRTFSASTQTEERVETESTDSENDEWTHSFANVLKENKKKPLDVLFKEAVGLVEKSEESESPVEEESKEGDVKVKLRKLEAEVKRLHVENLEKKLKILSNEEEEEEEEEDQLDENIERTRRLSSLFSLSNKPLNLQKLKEKVKPRPTELSTEMVSLVRRFYEEGYFRNANFLKLDKLDISCFSEDYPRDFLRFAAERFGQDHREIATWLSGSDLKRVAQFGCPFTEKGTVFAAKRLRAFFSIQEDTVCRTCKLKSSCKFANQRVWKNNNLNLADAMRVLTLYDLGSISPQLVVPDEMKESISRLLKEVISLTE